MKGAAGASAVTLNRLLEIASSRGSPPGWNRGREILTSTLSGNDLNSLCSGPRLSYNVLLMDRKQIGSDSKLEIGELNSEVRVSIDNESRASFSVQSLEGSQLPAVSEAHGPGDHSTLADECTLVWLLSGCFGCVWTSSINF